MAVLSDLKCETCSSNARLLTFKEIESLLPEVLEWEVIDDSGIQKLKRKFQTNNYQKSLSFTNELAALAVSINHHPQIIVEYSSVTVVWWSHIIKGLHKNDFIMASKTSDLFRIYS
jgi:4a-hydroxytetrahydrobiopterin dehydratase